MSIVSADQKDKAAANTNPTSDRRLISHILIDFQQRSQNYTMEKRKHTNYAGLTGCLYVEECKCIYIYHPAQN